MSSGERMLINKDGSDAISGFYYDQQLENRNLIMTLHPNMEYTGVGPSYWGPFTKELCFDNPPGTDQNLPAYRKEPLVKCIIPEDFQIGVANNWADQGLAEDLQGMFNSVKPFAPLMDRAGDELAKIHEEEKAAGKSGKASGIVSSILKKGPEYLNRALVIQPSRFSYYSGTGIAFGNMTMKFTLFSDWDLKTGEFRSCIDRLEDIIPYAVGKYVTLKNQDPTKQASPQEDTNTSTTSSSGKKKSFKENVIEYIEDVGEIANQFIGWQIPPGGFTADLKSVDNIQKGTLRLIIGTMYSISNLVIQDIQFNFSKQIMKKPSNIGNKKFIEIYPMYCDVQLTLKPASKYTDVSLYSAIQGLDILRLRSDEEDIINKRLETIRNNLDKI